MRQQIRITTKVTASFAAVSILAAIATPRGTAIAAAGIIALILLIIDRGALYFLCGRRFWTWMISGMAVLPLLGGGQQVELLGLKYSLETLAISIRISSRGFMIFTGMALIRRHISPQMMADVLFKLGMRKIGYLIPLSFHIVPLVMESMLNTYMVWKHRGGWKGKLLSNLSLLAVSMQVQLVREAEDLAAALYLNNLKPKSHSKRLNTLKQSPV